ncbi:MAG: minor capsid protein [Treponema sp.]|jgi:SPP1 gp7 family putative phage head morphogenesis protein|nr:minor capsid protein [Treponema sp.]
MEAPYRYRLTESLLKRTRDWIQSAADKPDLLKDEHAILPPDYDAIEAVHEMFMRSFLMGIDHALAGSKKSKKNFADDMPVDALPFEQAVQFLKTKIPLTKKEYYALDDRLRLRAFTVGRLNDADAVNRMKGIMLENLEQGGTFAKFMQKTDNEILNGIGFGRGDGAYYETVYRTNQTTIYNAGRAKAYEETPPIALELLGIDDTRQTDICHSLTVPPFRRKYNDPVWETLWPPFHFNCRTTVRAIYDEAEIEEAGGENKFYTQGDRGFKPEKGFGRYPLDHESYWRLTPEMLDRARQYGIDGEIAEAAIQLGMSNYANQVVRGGFETLYPAGGKPMSELASGGYVRRAKMAAPSEKEIELAMRAADEGHRVFFMKKDDREISPDVIIDRHTAEIKHVSGTKKYTIENRINAGRKQHATFILIEVPDAYQQEEITRQVKSRLRQIEHLQNVLVSWRGRILPYAK